MPQSTRAERIQRELASQAGIHVVVGETDNAIILSGRVPDNAARKRAVAIARSLTPDKRIENSLEVERIVAEGVADTIGPNVDGRNPDDLVQSPPAILGSTGLDAGLGNVPLETEAEDVVDPTVFDDTSEVEPDPAYFPPTDPVIGTGQQGEVDVLNGWTPTSDASDEIAPSAEDNQPGDEALAEAIKRELREDASTTALQIEVQVDRGVARLRGKVDDLEDAENAESVAGRVPGVRDVIEDLDVTNA